MYVCSKISNMVIDEILVLMLKKQGRVSIPNIGKIEITYSAANIDETGNKIKPPSSNFHFENVKADFLKDEFIKSIKQIQPSLSQPDIDFHIKECITIADNAILGKGYFFKNIGKISYESGNFIFVPDKDSFLLQDFYGLEDVKVPESFKSEPKTTEAPSVSNKETVTPKVVNLPPPVPHQTKKPQAQKTGIPKYVKIAIAISAIFIVVSITYTYWGKISSKKGLFGFFNTTSDKKQEKEKTYAYTDTLENKIDAEALKRKALDYSEDTIQKSPIAPNARMTYYIIAGSFKTSNNAEKLVTDLIKKGFEPKIISLGDTLFRVSLKKFKVRTDAIDEYVMISKTHPDLKIWVYSRIE